MSNNFKLLLIGILLVGCVAGELGDEKVTSQGGLANFNPVVSTVTDTSSNTVGNSFGGGPRLTITGANFATNAVVSVGNSECDVVTRTPTIITCDIEVRMPLTNKTPWGSGPTNVTVTNIGDNKNGTLANGYTWIHPAPTITSITPSTTNADGTTPAPLTVQGNFFRDGASVNIGALVCGSVNVIDRTQLTCAPPASSVPSARRVTVINLGGGSGTSTNHFVYQYSTAPTITSVYKIANQFGSATETTLTASFSTAGDEVIGVTGTGIFNGAKIAINGVTIPTVFRMGELRGITSPTATGTYPVTIVGADLQVSPPSLTYTTAAPPYLTSFENNAAGVTATIQYGPLAGGYQLELNGSGFATGDRVGIVDGTTVTECTGATVTGSTGITCNLPAMAAGDYLVKVQSSSMMETTSTGTYQWVGAPTITGVAAVSPSSAGAIGNITGGTRIRLTGANFRPNMNVVLDTGICTNFNLTSSMMAECDTPAHAAGQVNVTVTNEDTQTATLTNGFEYVAGPAITSVVNQGNTAISFGPMTGAPIRIIGTNFSSAGVNVEVGGAGTCTAPTVNAGGTEIDCNAPATITPAGAYDVVVTNQNSSITTTSTGAWSYLANPTITGVFNRHTLRLNDNLNFGQLTAAANYRALITSTNHGTVAAPPTIFFGNNAATIVASTPTGEFSVAVPTAASPGLADVRLVRADGITVTATGAWRYVDAPTITSLSPTTGRQSINTPVSMMGTNYQSAGGNSIVTIGTTTTTGTFVSSNQIDFSAPPGSGVVNIELRSPDGQSANLASAFNYIPAPTITGATASTPSPDGRMSLTVTGTNFLPSTQTSVILDFGPNQTSCSINSPITNITATGITCIVPAHSGATKTVNVRVINPDGQFAETTTAPITLRARPTITTIAPNSGPLAGGTPVTLTGTGFFTVSSVVLDPGGLAVNCGGITATATTLNCTIAASTPVGTFHPAGTYDIRLTNGDGQVNTLANAYTFRVAPTITSVAPTLGAVSGGTQLLITGSDFVPSPLPTVTLDPTGTPSTCNNVSATATNITCTTSAHAAATVDLQVENYDGQSTSLAGAYQYINAPVLTSVSPIEARVLATTPITITGQYFRPGATVAVGSSAACNPVTVNAAGTQINCTVASSVQAGSENVVVANPDGQQTSPTSAGVFHFRANPGITSVRLGSNSNINYGPTLGGYRVTLAGGNFYNNGTAPMGVTIDGLACSSVNVSSNTSLNCLAPPHAATLGVPVDVAITNSVGQTATLTGAWEYVNAPTITSVSPNGAYVSGNRNITVSGTNFIPSNQTAVRINSSSSNPVACPIANPAADITATSIRCNAPPHPAGVVNLQVTNPDGQSAAIYPALTYRSAPTVTSISPSAGDKSGGSRVTITGSNFFSPSAISLGGSSCGNISVVSSTELQCTTGLHANDGTYEVTVTNGDGQSATTYNLYTYNTSAGIEWQSGVGIYGSNTTNVTHTFTLTNIGSLTSSEITVSLKGDNPGAWYIATETCSGSGNELDAGDSCIVQVTFLGALLASGNYSATIEATATSGGTATRNLTGSKP